jgi:AcrR family transcriptional regulator
MAFHHNRILLGVQQIDRYHAGTMTKSPPRRRPGKARDAMRRRPRTRPAIADYRRRTLIEGAIRSLAEHGVAGTTLKTIAEAAGASHGLVGHYFGAKDDLLAAAYRHLCGTIAHAIARLARDSGPDALARLDATVAVTFDPPVFDPVNLRAFVMFWHEALANPTLRAIKHELYDDYRATTARLFERVAAERGIAIDSRAASIGLLALIDGLWLELALDPATCTPAEAKAIGRAYIVGALASPPPDKDTPWPAATP